MEPVRAKTPYAFPWSFWGFFGVLPDCVLGHAPDIEAPSFTPDDKFDLVILAYQVWFLAPSLPIQGFLASPFARVLRDTRVITLVVCRNMWHTASETMKRLLALAGAIHIDNVVLTDPSPPLASFVTTPRWMFTGKRDRFMGFPPAGVPGGGDPAPLAVRHGDLERRVLARGARGALDPARAGGRRRGVAVRAARADRTPLLPALGAGSSTPRVAPDRSRAGRRSSFSSSISSSRSWCWCRSPPSCGSSSIRSSSGRSRRTSSGSSVPRGSTRGTLSSPETKRRGAVAAPYITGVGAFLPNAPVDNDGIESVLGLLNGTPSRIKRRILRNNGIRTRHYAVEPGTGRPTHTNARMTAEAIHALARQRGVRPRRTRPSRLRHVDARSVDPRPRADGARRAGLPAVRGRLHGGGLRGRHDGAQVRLRVGDVGLRPFVDRDGLGARLEPAARAALRHERRGPAREDPARARARTTRTA